MGFARRVRCTGGGWPTVLDAQWLVDGSDSPRCRWTRTWSEPIQSGVRVHAANPTLLRVSNRRGIGAGEDGLGRLRVNARSDRDAPGTAECGRHTADPGEEPHVRYRE